MTLSSTIAPSRQRLILPKTACFASFATGAEIGKTATLISSNVQNIEVFHSAHTSFASLATEIGKTATSSFQNTRYNLLRIFTCFATETAEIGKSATLLLISNIVQKHVVWCPRRCFVILILLKVAILKYSLFESFIKPQKLATF